MASTNDQIQVISTVDHTEQHLVSIPPVTATLAPSSVRVRSSLLSLIHNTISCASHPEVKIGWWDVYPLPSNTPAPFNDPTKYGRIGVWGFATVLESTFAGIEIGASIFGFFPIATLPVDLHLKGTDAARIYREISPIRATALRIYNTFEVYDDTVADETSKALDALSKITFRLAYLLARYTFDPNRGLHPSSSGEAWTSADADLTDSVVVLVSGTSKTALSLAYMLARPDQAIKPARVVALTSAGSASFAEATGWYSDVLTYDKAEQVAKLGTSGRKVVIIDFGGREDSAARVRRAVEDEAATVQHLSVGRETKRGAVKVTPEVVAAMNEAGIMAVNTSNMIESAESAFGEENEGKMYEEYDKAWGDLKKHGFPGMEIAWGNGLEEYTEMYERLCNGESLKPHTSFVYKI